MWSQTFGLLLYMDVYCGLDESLSACWNEHDFLIPTHVSLPLSVLSFPHVSSRSLCVFASTLF